MMTSTASALGALFGATLLVVPGLASAGPGRDGAMLSIGIGAGRLGCSTDNGEDCDGTGSIQAGGIVGEAGLMLAPSLAIAGELFGAVNNDDNFEVSQWVLAGTVRVWPVPLLWLEGGLGVARSQVKLMNTNVDFVAQSDTVPAIVGGLGIEALSSPKFAIDVALRGATGMYEQGINVYQVTLGVGATFF
jgi:hypothetical protein